MNKKQTSALLTEASAEKERDIYFILRDEFVMNTNKKIITRFRKEC